ncbi:MAG: UDP-N-acetylmuramate:L-alanyl-gamma-D-glutamyl-meso-diaminopimelate ligase [Desulfobacterales bacterium]|nr:MAG: UDP-N-acetylmuramate:L-alanyl-gamma-D-glutamyl-meso-diaminopimelate ligase [Desulfobacterales bacterium]
MKENIKNIHMIAVCGTGMGALARMLKDQGFEITGSDHKVYPPMSHFLRDAGIEISDGFNEKNVAYGPDLVVVGNAVSKDNAEVVKMHQMGLAYCSMPQAINRFVAAGKKPLVVTGTHGKTTTASILAWILQAAGFDPSFIIGGILKNFNSNYRLGSGEYIIIEGDEYDTAFFDKGPKFYHYHPCMAVLTGVEFDHADIFKDLDHVRQAFDGFLSRMYPESALFAFTDDKNVVELMREKSCRMVTYGKDAKAMWRLGAISVDPPWVFFEVIQQGFQFGIFKTKLIGEHNLVNALSVIAMANELKIPKEATAAALETFQGVKRRQDVRGTKRGITVMDDFAHHPTAVNETLRAVKPFYPYGRIVAVFEPRTNSSMRNIFQKDYTLSFDDADLICIRNPSRLDKIPPTERFSSRKLVADLIRRGKNAHYFSDTESIINHLVKEARHDDLVLIMSNGGFDNIHERLLQSL